MDLFDIQLKRNQKGLNLEHAGHVDEAILLYEANLAEDFEGSHPYVRLAKIYAKRQMDEQQVRVLEKAIAVFEKSKRSDARFMVFKFKTKL